MWICIKCGEQMEDQFKSCWKCSTSRTALSPVAATPPTETPKQRVAYRAFRGTFVTWEKLFADATAFASELAVGQLINISHSADQGDGVVVVWYLTTEEQPDP